MPSLAAGGTERVAASLTRWLIANAGVDDAALVTIEGNDPDFYDAGDALRLSVWPEGRRRKSRLRTVIRLRRQLTYVNPDVVLALGAFANVTTMTASLARPWRVIISERNEPTRPYSFVVRVARRILYRRAAICVVLTPAMLPWLKRQAPGLKASVIPNAFEPRTVAPAQKRDLRILSIGSLTRQKGHDVLIRAYAAIPEPQRTDWCLRIVGDGPELTSLREAAGGLGISSQIEFVSAHRDVASEYGSASIFALASRYEGFPNVVLEAMANGLPVVVSDLAGARSLICETDDGDLIPPGDVTAFSMALARLMFDSARRDLMGRAAKNRAAQYTEDAIYPRWLTLISHISEFR